MQSEPISEDSPQDQTTTNIQPDYSQKQQKKVYKLNIDPNRKKYGNMVVFCEKPFLLCLGPDYLCFIPTFLMFCGLGYLLCMTVQKNIQNKIIIWAAYIMSVAQCGSYLLTAISNPGIVLRDKNNPITEITQQNKYRVCKTCGADVRRKTYHCRDCDVCVEGYDHHCPWTSKCIGKKNLYPFFAFVSITPIYIVTFIGLMMACLAVNANNVAHHKNLKTHN